MRHNLRGDPADLPMVDEQLNVLDEQGSVPVTKVAEDMPGRRSRSGGSRSSRCGSASVRQNLRAAPNAPVTDKRGRSPATGGGDGTLDRRSGSAARSDVTPVPLDEASLAAAAKSSPAAQEEASRNFLDKALEVGRAGGKGGGKGCLQRKRGGQKNKHKRGKKSRQQRQGKGKGKGSKGAAVKKSQALSRATPQKRYENTATISRREEMSQNRSCGERRSRDRRSRDTKKRCRRSKRRRRSKSSPRGRAGFGTYQALLKAFEDPWWEARREARSRSASSSLSSLPSSKSPARRGAESEQAAPDDAASGGASSQGDSSSDEENSSSRSSSRNVERKKDAHATSARATQSLLDVSPGSAWAQPAAPWGGAAWSATQQHQAWSAAAWYQHQMMVYPRQHPGYAPRPLWQ